mmetsp:Transcript_27540/g.55427  ORF Transcript_27540/g.55427 Transcript_27540/m.55427 type:complete len:82 (-) Transcript_27540:38-283(-)
MQLRCRAEAVLSQACSNLLAQFPTTIVQDEALLQHQLAEDSEELSQYRLTQCIRSRLSRKRCLDMVVHAVAKSSLKVRPRV